MAAALGAALLFGLSTPAAKLLVPSAEPLMFGSVLGLVSYGTSVVLAVHAMRLIGVAREAAFFATAPFIGALASVVVLGEHFGSPELGAGDARRRQPSGP
jgi:drug/metabolite transporter (DMT)-like permease